MESSIFFETPQVKSVMSTSLTTEQYQWLRQMLMTYCSDAQFAVKDHPNVIDSDVVSECIVSIRNFTSRFECPYPLDLTDELLTELITKYGTIRHSVEIIGDVHYQVSELIEVPLDTDISEIKEMPDYDFCDFFEYDVSDATTYLDPDYYDLSIDRVVTHVKFDLPSPIVFSDTQQLRDVA